MKVKVILPSLLRRHTGGKAIVEMEKSGDIIYNVEECVRDLTSAFPELSRWLYGKQGEVAAHVHLFANSRKVSIDHSLKDDDELLILLAVSGG